MEYFTVTYGEREAERIVKDIDRRCVTCLSVLVLVDNLTLGSPLHLISLVYAAFPMDVTSPNGRETIRRLS